MNKRRGALAALFLAALAPLACSDGEGESTATTESTDGAEALELWCTRYGRFAAAAALVEVDATDPDAVDRLDAVRAGTDEAADDLAAATEEAEVLLLDTPVPAAISEDLPALLASADGELDQDALEVVEAHVASSCQEDAAHLALLARLGGG